MPTALTVASRDTEFAKALANALHGPALRAYTTEDVLGVQVGGTVKNVLAIAAGICDGLGYGANARAALLTRGMAEIMRLASILGAEPETMFGLSGMGDLILTCTDNQSRNRRFGLALGKGVGVEQAMADIGQVVEGYRNTKEVYMLAQRMGVEMPIVEQVYQVLYCGKDARLAAADLLSRDRKFE